MNPNLTDMKNLKLFLLPSVFVVVLGLSSWIVLHDPMDSPGKNNKVEIPENVKMVMDNKCHGCHNMESSSEKAQEALLIDKLDMLTKAKLIFTLGDIEEVMEEDKMPPKKFLEKYPEKALSGEERELIRSWAVTTAEKMLQ